MVWFSSSGDVVMVWFWYSGDAECVLQLGAIAMVWFCSSGDVVMVWFWYSGDVQMVWFLKLGRCWFSLVFALGRRQIHPQTPYISRVSTTSPESNHTPPEGENPSGDVSNLDEVIVGQPKRSAWPLFHSFFFDPFPNKLVTNIIPSLFCTLDDIYHSSTPSQRSKS